MTSGVPTTTQPNPAVNTPSSSKENISVRDRAGRTWANCKTCTSSSAPYVAVAALVVGFLAALSGAGVFSSYLQVSLRGIGSISQAYGLYTLLGGSIVTFVTGVLLLATCMNRKAGGAHEQEVAGATSWKDSCFAICKKKATNTSNNNEATNSTNEPAKQEKKKKPKTNQQ